MRIGTWNMAGRWGARHAAFLERHACDVWLLTEVHAAARVDGHDHHATTGSIRPGVAWACVTSRTGLHGLPEPHPATAAARVGAVTFLSSVLPWRSCGSGPPWQGTTTGARTFAAVEALFAALGPGPVVWGGDWNHALVGTEGAGSTAGRESILRALERRALRAPTRDLPHRRDGHFSIDHVAIPATWPARAVRIEATWEGAALSDHDAYAVDVDDPVVA